MTNPFEEMDKETEVSQDAATVPQKTGPQKRELSPEDALGGADFIKLPEVGESLEFTIEKVEENPDVTGKNKETGETFGIGCKRKDGTYVRRDVTTDKGILTINSWELFYKLFGKDSDVMKIALQSGWNGIKVKITRNFNGNYAMKPIKEIAKLLDKTDAEAEAYKKEVATAMKENRLLTVEVLN